MDSAAAAAANHNDEVAKLESFKLRLQAQLERESAPCGYHGRTFSMLPGVLPPWSQPSTGRLWNLQLHLRLGADRRLAAIGRAWRMPLTAGIGKGKAEGKTHQEWLESQTS